MIENITDSFFPASWDSFDFSSPGTQVVAATIVTVALAALTILVNNRKKHSLTIKNTDNKLAITITGGRKGIPQHLIDEANAAIGVWRKSWKDKLFSEDNTECVTFSTKIQYNESRYDFTLTAQKADRLQLTQQAVEIKYLDDVTFQSIPKKQKTMRSPAGGADRRRRSLPVRGGAGLSRNY